MKTAKITITVDIDIESESASTEQLKEWLRYELIGDAQISPNNPLVDVEPTITDSCIELTGISKTESISDAKIDDRPQLGFWAPGNYINRCTQCEDLFIGDKRAVVCADCAYSDEDK